MEPIHDRPEIECVFLAADDLLRVRLPSPSVVHLWKIHLDENEKLQDHSEHLSVEETARVARFRFPKVQVQFTLARGWLRKILGQYLNRPGRELIFDYEPGGKPYLSPGHNPCRLQFNVSHSGDWAVIAVAVGSRIGVDIEQRRQMPNADALVDRYFSVRERDLFRQVPEVEKVAAFYRAWTRKEAILKAIGSGVQSLDSCDVTFLAEEPCRLLRLVEDFRASDHWYLRSWEWLGDYEAAVAVERD